MADFTTMNATYSGIGTVATMMPILILGCVLFGITLAVFSADWIRRYMGMFNLLGRTFTYTAKGGLISVCGYALWSVSSFVGEMAGYIDPMIYAYVVSGFIGLTMIGYVGDKAYIRLSHNYRRAKR